MKEEGIALQDIPSETGAVQALRYTVLNLDGRGSILLEI